MDRDKPVSAVKPASKIAWRWIIPVVVVVSLGIAALLFGPVITHEREAREIQRIKRVYADGLSPCDQHDISGSSTNREPAALLPATPTLSITAYSAFNDIESVHLVGREIYYVRRQVPAREYPPRPVGSRIPKVVKVGKACLSEPVSLGMVELVEGDITHATAEWPLGLDGTIYYFDTSKGCAMAWSPDSDTRAGKMVDLFWSLAARAKNDVPSKDDTGDAALLRTIDALRSGS